MKGFQADLPVNQVIRHGAAGLVMEFILFLAMIFEMDGTPGLIPYNSVLENTVRCRSSDLKFM